MTTDNTGQRITQGGQLHTCRTCARDSDNWIVIPIAETAQAEYHCPEPGCTGAFIGELRIFAKRGDATDGPEFRQ